jgi:hypothetical protein
VEVQPVEVQPVEVQPVEVQPVVKAVMPTMVHHHKHSIFFSMWN